MPRRFVLGLLGLGAMLWAACREPAAPGRPDFDATPASTGPQAAFAFDCTQLTCQFTDFSVDSTAPIVIWSWFFGDGDSSSLQHPTHTYGGPGSYPVTLFITDSAGASDSVTRFVAVANDTTPLPPHAAFAFSCSALTCQFFDQSSDSDGVIVRYHWVFGDSATDTVPNPVHTYAAAGTYQVFHAVVDNDSLIDSVSQAVTVTGDTGGGNQPPQAFFDFNCSALTCQFTDLSVDSGGAVVQWTWLFGDGGTDTTQNPQHTYAAAGSYPVTLFVRDNEGASDSTVRLVTVTADTGGGNQPPQAFFDFTCSALTCQFTDLSVDSGGAVVQWTWLFGDGGSDTTQNPQHTYAAFGSYTVTLFVRDNEGASDSTARLVTVSDTTSPAVLTLVAEGFRQKGVHHARLLWSGATVDSIAVFRDGIQVAALSGTSTYVDNIGARGGHATYVYRVCQVGGGNECSNTATVTF